MTARPKRTKKDANQRYITKRLVECGMVVESIADTCRWADIMVWGYDAAYEDVMWRVFEIKMPGEGLTDPEREFQEKHPGAVRTVYTYDEVLEAFGRV